MGEVYRARDTRLGREVALKVLSRIASESLDRRTRFEREARLLATLNHPAIAAIHGLEHEAGTPVLVMELVEGETLDRRLDRGPLPVRQGLEIGRQVAEGLEAAHGKGIIHRDLKPSNIQVTPEGKVKLLDFGLAKALQLAVVSSDVATRTFPQVCYRHVGRAGLLIPAPAGSGQGAAQQRTPSRARHSPSCPGLPEETSESDEPRNGPSRCRRDKIPRPPPLSSQPLATPA